MAYANSEAIMILLLSTVYTISFLLHKVFYQTMKCIKKIRHIKKQKNTKYICIYKFIPLVFKIWSAEGGGV